MRGAPVRSLASPTSQIASRVLVPPMSPARTCIVRGTYPTARQDQATAPRRLPLPPGVANPTFAATVCAAAPRAEEHMRLLTKSSIWAAVALGAGLLLPAAVRAQLT